MIVDLVAYTVGLLFPVLFLFELLPFERLKRRFSLYQYLAKNGTNRLRPHFWPSLIIGAITSLGLLIWGLNTSIQYLSQKG